MKLFVKQKKTHRHRKLTWGYQRGMREGINFGINIYTILHMDFPGGASGKEPACQCRTWEGPLEEGMATHSSILAGRIPWIEEPGWLQSIRLQRVGHD